MREATALDPRIASGSDYGDPDPAWRRIDWRRHLRTVELPGSTVNYVELGEGEPVLFLHGVSGCWQNWLENLPHAGARRRAIAIDLPGFGGSPMPSWPIDMPAYGRLVHDFCERLGLGGATLVGNSMGGLVAVEAVTSNPQMFNRLVLVSAAGILNTWKPEAWVVAAALAWRRLGPLLADRSRWIVSRPRSRHLVMAPFVHYPGRLRPDLLLEQASGARGPAFGEALRDALRRDLRDAVGAIELPTLIVWGLSDRVIPVAAALSYHRRIPQSRLEIFERTGHLPQLERPLRFNRLLNEFLAG